MWIRYHGCLHMSSRPHHSHTHANRMWTHRHGCTHMLPKPWHAHNIHHAWASPYAYAPWQILFSPPPKMSQAPAQLIFALRLWDVCIFEFVNNPWCWSCNHKEGRHQKLCENCYSHSKWIIWLVKFNIITILRNQFNGGCNFYNYYSP